VNEVYNDEMQHLEKSIDEITEIAKGFGLDFYPMRYEICPADIIYTFGAYGMPTRFSHWSFGKAFHRMKIQYDLGLSKIYELVINSNPCYAFLLDGNSLIQNKLIVAHVLAHCDFFKNNYRFSKTKRDMVESMAATAERMRQYEMEHGSKEVESFLDAILAIQEHVDPSLHRKRPGPVEVPEKTKWKEKKRGIYEDLWQLDQSGQEESQPSSTSLKKKVPENPEKDLLFFLEQHSDILQDWQCDILSMMREEMLYFWPQIETKVMNEGWASYWHLRIIRELDLGEEETIEFSKLNSGVLQPSKQTINPYYLGFKMFEDIERRWDQPTEEEEVRFNRKPGTGRKKIFEVREMDSDTSFIRNYLTKELVEDLDLYLFQKNGNDWVITDKTWENIRDQLVSMRVNGGFPHLVVEDGNFLRNRELLLIHRFEGLELDLKYVEKTLPYVYQLWGKPVHLESTVEERKVMFTYDGKKCHRRFL
jgi:stage V sporulation protein R